MHNFLQIVQITISLLLLGFIVLQAKGTGLGRAWGGAGEFYKSRRGVEKLVFRATIILAFLFLVSSVANLLVG